MGSLEKNIFGDKKFSDLLAEIYENQKKKEKTISGLVRELKDLVNDVSDATVIVPLIANYLEIGVKNDEHLLKMATIIQRIFNNQGDGGGDGLSITEAEREELMAQLDQLQKPLDDK
jgi:hypothetical protein